MTQDHEARPTGEWGHDGAGICAVCGGRLIEAVYTGGWMHALETPHSFKPFVFGDGVAAQGGSCLDCAKPRDDEIHPQG